MFRTTVTVDYNGIVIFDPVALASYFGGAIELGTNILSQLMETSLGDTVTAEGGVIPILGLNDSVYEFILRLDVESSEVEDLIIVENGTFPLQVVSHLVVADAAVFIEWEESTGWQNLPVASGVYGVTIRGFREIKQKQVVRFGFEAVLSPASALPAMTARLDMAMQVLSLPAR